MLHRHLKCLSIFLLFKEKRGKKEKKKKRERRETCYFIFLFIFLIIIIFAVVLIGLLWFGLFDYRKKELKNTCTE